jgi:hypothetical protein
MSGHPSAKEIHGGKNIATWFYDALRDCPPSGGIPADTQTSYKFMLDTVVSLALVNVLGRVFKTPEADRHELLCMAKALADEDSTITTSLRAGFSHGVCGAYGLRVLAGRG